MINRQISKSPRDCTPIGIALIGAGTVGGAVLQILQEQRLSLPMLCGRPFRLTHVVVRDVAAAKKRLDKAVTNLLTNDWHAAVTDPKTDIIVELIGGDSVAKDCIRAALAANKPVITANKALLAITTATDDDILALAESQQLPVAYEAAVAGCIPIVRLLREALVGDPIREIYGVLNGTCNYILTAMEADQLSFPQALANAQKLGYAEADPALDIEGGDSAHKLLLMTQLAFAVRPQMSDISTIGINHFDWRDIDFARRLNFRIKLLAVAKYTDQHQLELRVRPTLVPAHCLLASVEAAMNAVVVRSDFAGETMYYGAGAGAKPSAAAVVADIVDIIRHYNPPSHRSQTMKLPTYHDQPPPTLTNQFASPHYLRLHVTDRPGILADVTRLLAKQQISIEEIHQNESIPGQLVDIVILLHHCPHDSANAAVCAISQMTDVIDPIIVMPIERL